MQKTKASHPSNRDILTVSVAIVAVCAFIFVLWETNRPIYVANVFAPYLKHGDTLVLVRFDASYAAKRYRFCLRQGGRTRVITSLRDLEGAVAIKSTSDALDLLRLSTLYPYAFETPWEVEIQEDTSRQTYQFALPNRLPNTVFRDLGFDKPTVQIINDRYLISRWVFSYSPEQQRGVILSVNEFLTNDGLYHRNVIKALSPPTIPTVRWIIPHQQ